MGKKIVKDRKWSRKQLAAQLLAQSAAYRRNKKVTVSKPPWEKLYDRPDFIKVKKPSVD